MTPGPSHGLTSRVGSFDTQDALYDLAWSERHENQLVVACGDGAVKLFDVGLDEFPVQAWQEHTREVYAVHWNLVAKDTFCSSSWDGCVKIVSSPPPPFHLNHPPAPKNGLVLNRRQYSPHRPASLVTLPTGSCTYSAAFSPHSPSLLSAVSSDARLRLFDLRAPTAHHCVLTLPTHAPHEPPAEALTHDWNKYREGVVAVAGVDRLVRTFDIRGASGGGDILAQGGVVGGADAAGKAGPGPLAVLAGHEYAVRRVAWSPHLPDVLLSAGYDMSVRAWSDGSAVGGVGPEPPRTIPAQAGGPRQLGRMDAHSEFVVGLDWCLFGAEGWCASCGWDERVLVWDVRSVMGPP